MSYLVEGDMIELCLESSQEGGKIAERKKRSANKRKKKDDTFVTEADIEVEKTIRGILKENTKYPVLGEEKGGDIENSETYWVVDPIDGTQNYAYHQPFYGTSVALIKNREPFVGSFYMPELDYMFYAKKDSGAYLNKTKLSVNKNTKLGNSYINLTGRYIPKNTNEICQHINSWFQSFSCAIQSQCWTASGWNDACIAGKIYPWDFASGSLILRESGGVVKTLKNSSTKWNDIRNGGLVMANEKLADDIIDSLPENLIENLND